MKKLILALAATAAFASPALANETRVEARGGVIWDSGVTEDVYGVALGYDFDLGSSAFAGVEVSGDKIATTGTKVAFGLTGRLGAKMGTSTKLFVDGGYTTESCDLCDSSIHAGVGVEQALTSNVYGKLAYRHYFFDNNVSDSDAVVVGVGFKF
ncbi:outer membrane protein [Novosphingobium aquae]|jgi:outer membrane immunogenic protein|uniref:Outer membrane beta-barrel protein n=1 Tax=Novosphingobium aquae TaxID=3133435 RepID=A0ABU8S856_9SPHN